MRRAGSVLLVQWAHGRSLGDAGRYLGIHTGRSQHSFGPNLARLLGDHGTKEFTAALISLAAQRSVPGSAKTGYGNKLGDLRDRRVPAAHVPSGRRPGDGGARSSLLGLTWADVVQLAGRPRIKRAQPAPQRPLSAAAGLWLHLLCTARRP
jgi:hypothetical protein